MQGAALPHLARQHRSELVTTRPQKRWCEAVKGIHVVRPQIKFDNLLWKAICCDFVVISDQACGVADSQMIFAAFQRWPTDMQTVLTNPHASIFLIFMLGTALEA